MDAAYTGQQIAERRKALGMTQKALAEKLHVTDKAVSKWERGINFPDLGLMESLASVLETTPACLLGLEDADRDALVSSITEISNEQVEEAQKELRFIGWCCIAIALLTGLVYWLFYDRDLRDLKLGYPLLNILTIALTGGGWYLLGKYGHLKALEPEDLGVFSIALIPLLILLGYQYLTGFSINTFWTVILMCCIAVGIQWYFCRIIRPFLGKALPAIAAMLYILWQLTDGYCPPEFWIPALVCCLVLFFCTRKKA